MANKSLYFCIMKFQVKFDILAYLRGVIQDAHHHYRAIT